MSCFLLMSRQLLFTFLQLGLITLSFCFCVSLVHANSCTHILVWLSAILISGSKHNVSDVMIDLFTVNKAFVFAACYYCLTNWKSALWLSLGTFLKLSLFLVSQCSLNFKRICITERWIKKVPTCLALSSSVPRLTGANISINLVSTRSSVWTRITGTFVDICK